MPRIPYRRRRGRPPHPDVLTPAEWRVLEYVRRGLTNAEIAIRLGISPETVKTHVSNMLAKLDLTDRQALGAWDGEPAASASPRRGLLGLGILGHGLLAAKATKLIVGVGLTAGVAVGVAAVAGALGESAALRTPPVGQLVAESLEEMDKLDSYRSTVVFDEGDIVAVVDWTATNRYHAVIDSSRTPTTAPVGGSFTATADTSATTVDAAGNVVESQVESPASRTGEVVLTDDRIYGRTCAGRERDCGPWSFIERPEDSVFATPTPSLEGGWVLVALERARDLRIIDDDARVEGVPAVALSGSVNHLRAILEYGLRRTLAVRGAANFGEQCTSSESASASASDPEPVRTETTEVCRPLTFAEILGMQEADLAFFDDQPARIDLWIARQDRYLLRARLQIPQPDLAADGLPAGDGTTTITVDFSLFDQVVIGEPAGAIPQELVGALRTVTGEFRGDIVISAEEIPPPGADPVRAQQGKFYLVNLAAGEGGDDGGDGAGVAGPGGLLALYWKDPHLGCTTGWEPDFEFEGATGWFYTPCHGEIYTKAGVRVFGPAPRSLDTFAVHVQADGSVVVDTTEPLPGDESNPLRAVAYP